MIFKTAEVPLTKHISQLMAAASVEGLEHIADMGLDGAQGDVQFISNLVVGIVLASQGCDFLLAIGERFPLSGEVVVGLVILDDPFAKDHCGQFFGGELLVEGYFIQHV